MKRSHDVDLDDLFSSLGTADDGQKPEHEAWASEFDDDDEYDDDDRDEDEDERVS